MYNRMIGRYGVPNYWVTENLKWKFAYCDFWLLLFPSTVAAQHLGADREKMEILGVVPDEFDQRDANWITAERMVLHI